MNEHDHRATARAMVAGDKGWLAMDESTETCNKRFAKVGIPQTEEARRAYREIWAGDEAQRAPAQRALLHRAKCNRAALRREYTAAIETAL